MPDTDIDAAFALSAVTEELSIQRERIVNAEFMLSQITGRTTGVDLEWQLTTAIEMMKPKPVALTTLEEVEKAHTLAVLGEVAGNKTLAARILGVDRRTIYRNLIRWGLTTQDD